jgi:glycosyltransferase involved in cell wall biosynthesis
MYLYIFFYIPILIIFRNYKVIVANGGVLANAILFFLGKAFKIKVIGISYGEELNVPLKNRNFKNSIKRKIINYSYKKASGFIVVCHFCKNLLVENFHVNAEKIDVIPSCLSRVKISNKSKLQKKKNSILSVGRLIERKGFHLLIDSASRLKSNVKNLTLTIIGDGPYKSFLEEIITKNNADSFIKLLDNVSEDSLQKLYMQSELFVLANHELENGDTEGCPSVFSEAMLYDLPLVGGKFAGVETAIINNENGLVVDVKNESELDAAILKILKDKSYSEFLSLNGKRKLTRDHLPEVVGELFKNSISRFLEDKPAKDFQKKFNSSTPSIII